MALFGVGKPVHLMEDIKVAKKLISELPAFDAAKALDKLTFWLNSISSTEGFKLDYRYELLDLLDGAAKNHQRKLAQEYLATDRQKKQRENQLWTTVYEFWKTLGSAYLHFEQSRDRRRLDALDLRAADLGLQVLADFRLVRADGAAQKEKKDGQQLFHD